MTAVVRWGRSAYETAADMAREREQAFALGLTWSLHEDRAHPPQDRGDVLVVTSQVRVREQALDQVQPRLVLTTTSGFEHIDLAACAARGVEVARCPLARRDAVVEATLASLIRLLRRLPDQEAAAPRGVWARAELPDLAPRSLSEAVIVVVGLGVIGREVDRHLTALGAQVRPVDPHVPGAWPLDHALAGADALTLHVAANDANRGLIGAAELDLLGQGAVVVNTARGDVLDVPAAVTRVRSERLGGLACDVFPEEPWPFLSEAGGRILFTPHASGFTRGLGQRVASEVGAALAAFCRGEPIPWRVNDGRAGPTG